MYTPRIPSDLPLTKSLVAKGTFQSAPMGLVDVGASGGIDQYWDVFGIYLSAVGFDPLIKEVERLNSLSQNGSRRYYANLVGYHSYSQLIPSPGQGSQTNLFERTSAAQAQRLSHCDYPRAFYDQTGEGAFAKDLVELDEFFLRTHPMDVDFVKIDTDGSDYQVLLGARELLARGPVLGVAVECQFHGLVHDSSNVFANIDRLLRQHGFSLFDIEVYRYSRAALPGPFVYRIPAQTTTGQVLWADALYFRDAGEQAYEANWLVSLTDWKILKLACLFEIFGLQDCTAELLAKYRHRLASTIDIDACLDLITPRSEQEKPSYRRYLDRFNEDPDSFFPPG